MSATNERLLALYRQGVAEFNARRYFECHESLETVWREVWRQVQRPFFQGLVQLAVGFHHLSTDNIRGALNLLERGLGNLAGYRPYHYGVDVDALGVSVRACLDELRSLGPERLGAFRWELVPTIALGDLSDLEREWT
jgi:hypothetical protein